MDSGVGGLTALKEVHKLLPEENIVYFGDTLNSPYGEKTASDIVSCVSSGIEFLKSENVKIILLACGTASSYIEKINCDIPILGIINKSCEKAIEISSNKKIGVLATSATVRSGKYKKNILGMCPNAFVYERACPKLATIIESGNIGGASSVLISCLSEYLKPINDLNLDTIILGCTHYPIIANEIKTLLLNKDIKFVIPGHEMAITLKQVLGEKNISADKNRVGQISYFVSGEKEKFCKTANIFLGHDVENSVLRV